MANDKPSTNSVKSVKTAKYSGRNLLELIRYIHLNSLRVGLAKTIDELDSYPWSVHAVLMGKQELSGQSIDDVLLLFGQKKKVARQAYREFVLDGIQQGKRDDLVGGGLRRSQGARYMGEYEAYDECSCQSA
jgi:hypothetical protein